jgi:hypothetical protein
MELIWGFIGRLYWELGPFFDWAFKNWAITFVTLLLLIRWTGNERRRIKHV